MSRQVDAHKKADGSAIYIQVQARGLTVEDTGRIDVPESILAPRLVLRGPGCVVGQVRDVLCVGPIGSRNDYLTASFSDAGTWISTGCFSSWLADFEVELQEKTGYVLAEYAAALDLIKVRAKARAAGQ